MSVDVTPRGEESASADREPTSVECQDFLQQIVYLIDNELDESDCADVRAHLESCNPCLARYDLQRTVKQVVARSCSEEAPDELRVKIMSTLRSISIETATIVQEGCPMGKPGGKRRARRKKGANHGRRPNA